MKINRADVRTDQSVDPLPAPATSVELTSEDVAVLRADLAMKARVAHDRLQTIRKRDEEIERLKAEWREAQLRATNELEAARNNIERAILILGPIHEKLQDEGEIGAAVGGALDVLAGWFGQNGKPVASRELLEQRDKQIAAQQRAVDAAWRVIDSTHANGYGHVQASDEACPHEVCREARAAYRDAAPAEARER